MGQILIVQAFVVFEEIIPAGRKAEQKHCFVEF